MNALYIYLVQFQTTGVQNILFSTNQKEPEIIYDHSKDGYGFGRCFRLIHGVQKNKMSFY
jgi:hypothetical protein